MKATVYIIRHAEAEGNIYRRCHGIYDSLLTPRAYQQLPCPREQVRKRGRSRRSTPLPWLRARTTAKAVAEPHGLSVELRNDLHEIDMGDWEDLPWAELPHAWPEQYAKWCSRPWEAAPPARRDRHAGRRTDAERGAPSGAGKRGQIHCGRDPRLGRFAARSPSRTAFRPKR